MNSTPPSSAYRKKESSPLPCTAQQTIGCQIFFLYPNIEREIKLFSHPSDIIITGDLTMRESFFFVRACSISILFRRGPDLTCNYEKLYPPYLNVNITFVFALRRRNPIQDGKFYPPCYRRINQLTESI